MVFSVLVNKNTGLFSNNATDNQSKNDVNVKMPYAMKTMMNELYAMGVCPRILPESDNKNPILHDHILKRASNIKSGERCRRRFNISK